MRSRKTGAPLRGLVAVSCVAAALFGARASAAAPPSATPRAAPLRVGESSETEAAQRWFARGLAALREDDWATARKAFGAAYALVPSVDILWNLATTERKLGDNVAALEHLRAYVISAEARADRRKIAEEELLPHLESVTAHLRVAEAEAAIVVVDGRRVGASATLDLVPGIHAVVVRVGADERSFAVETPAGVLTTMPSNEIRMGAASGSSPVTTVPRDSADAYVTHASASSNATSPSRGRDVAVLGLGGAAVLALAGGVYFSLAARSEQETSDRLQMQMRGDGLSCRRSRSLCDDFDTASSAAQRNTLVGTALLVSGGMLGGAAVAAWVLWPKATTHVTPMAGKDTAGITMVGRF